MCAIGFSAKKTETWKKYRKENFPLSPPQIIAHTYGLRTRRKIKFLYTHIKYTFGDFRRRTLRLIADYRRLPTSKIFLRVGKYRAEFPDFGRR